MRNYLLLLVVTLASAGVLQAQRFSTSKKERQNQEELSALLELSEKYYKSGNSDSLLIASNSLIEKASLLKNDSFTVVSYRINGNYYFLRNDYTKAIEKYLEGIRIAEKNKSISFILPQLYNNIGFNYTKLNYTELAAEYLLKGIKVATKTNNNRSLAYLYENMATLFLNQSIPDSAIFYLRQSEESNYRYASDKNFKPQDSSYIRASIYIDYGKTYALYYYTDSLYKYKTASANFFQKAMAFSKETNDQRHHADALYEYGLFLLNLGQIDSSRFYAKQSLEIAKKLNYLDLRINNADLLQRGYAQQSNFVLAHYYLKIKTQSTDTLSQLNHKNQILDLAFNEKLREKLAEEQKLEDEKQRHHYIELSLVAIGLVSVTILFLVLSRTFIVNASFIKYAGQICLLLVFEFINLATHPFIAEVTHHSTILMLLIMVAIASLLIPIHHKLEKYVKLHLVEKNEQIREAKAKQTLQELRHLKRKKRQE